MVSVTRTFTVDRPVDVVVDYLKDFTNAVEWDPGTVSCVRQDDGPVHVGSTWHNVSKVLGRKTDLSYTLRTLDAGRIVLVGHNRTATSTDDISVVPAPGGAEITYHSDIEFHGVAKIAGPLMKFEFERLGTKTEKSITVAVAGL